MANVGGYFRAPQYKSNEVPEEWRKHALEPWRILFPDLKWTLLERYLSDWPEALSGASRDS